MLPPDSDRPTDVDPLPLARESHPTLPYERSNPKAWFANHKKRRKLARIDLDEESTESGRLMPEWCVELGDGLRAMTTFELWMALARGEIGAETTVWRDGMEGWTQIAQIPELAYALADSVSFDPPLVTPAPLPDVALTPARGEARTPLTFTGAVAQTGDPPRVRSAEGDETHSEPISLPLRAWPFGRKGGSRGSFAGQGGLSFMLGCVVAVTAVGVALVHRGIAPVVLSGQGVGADRPTLVAGASELVSKVGQRTAVTVRQMEATPVAPPPPSARHHADPGQRRSRRGVRR
ncbi:DUF4339 domain-containing protein [Polyangium sp. 6x1]|uniref:DUF4339 domain-containing protein n=1 Tax=Polyangium sp. 6x1 TaxID=3042689 RepID=UPI0024822833|nr:DUF4339 domain-containing protein [Polyangium sp. 6x1]MDI1450056.1 DUF4339 domain-containing protein [Polyangium sp. 6x1]